MRYKQRWLSLWRSKHKIKDICGRCQGDLYDSDGGQTDYIACVTCLDATCLGCFDKLVARHGSYWTTELRCRYCRFSQWPTILHNGVKKTTCCFIDWLQRRALCLNVLQTAHPRFDTGGSLCDICLENHVGEFWQCPRGDINMCWRCFIQAHQMETMDQRCPGCRDELSPALRLCSLL